MGDSPDLLAVERLVLRAMAALVVFVLGLGVAAASRVSEERGYARQEADAATVDQAGPTGGPLLGVEVAAYATGRRRALAAADGRLAAVVSFAGYQRESDALALVKGTAVQALLVAPPGGEPAVATGDLPSWARALRLQASTEQASLLRMAATTDDPEFAAQFRADATRLGGLLTRLDPAGDLVFGAVVQAPAAGLRALAAKPGVRLVDVIGPAVPIDLAALSGLRPEETARAGEPPTRPL